MEIGGVLNRQCAESSETEGANNKHKLGSRNTVNCGDKAAEHDKPSSVTVIPVLKICC